MAPHDEPYEREGVASRFGAVEAGRAERPGGRRPDPAFWAGKRVFLTGYTGFKGAWAVLWLERLGAQVTGVALAPQGETSLYDLAGVASSLSSQFADLRGDRSMIDALVELSRADLVLHLAEQSSEQAFAKDPAHGFATNVVGTVNLLDVLRRQSELKAVLVASSGRVYADVGRGCAETDPIGGKGLYAASKAACEAAVGAFGANCFEPRGVALGVARAGAVIGGGDYSGDQVTARVVRAVEARQSPVLTAPETMQPWQHVLDCIAGYLVYLEVLATDPAAPRVVNFGPPSGAATPTVGELATFALEVLGSERPWRCEPDSAGADAGDLLLDTTLAGERLQFESRLAPEHAVVWTIDWHRAVAAGADAREVTLAQIAAYERLP